MNVCHEYRLHLICDPTFWSAIWAVWALVSGIAAVFYFLWTIKLVSATHASIQIWQKQLDILKEQMKQQKDEATKRQQKEWLENMAERQNKCKERRLRLEDENISQQDVRATYKKLKQWSEWYWILTFTRIDQGSRKTWRWNFTPHKKEHEISPAHLVGNEDFISPLAAIKHAEKLFEINYIEYY